MAVPSFTDAWCLPNSTTGRVGNKRVEEKKKRMDVKT
jgi:hypothetical protein